MSEEMSPEEAKEAQLREAAEMREHYRQETRAQIWNRDDTGHDLTVDESLFCRSYIIDREPVAAMRRLGYALEPQRLKSIASRYLANPEVQNCIDVLAKRMMERLEVTAEKVLGRIAQVAFFDPRTVMYFDGVSLRILDSSLWPDEAVAAIAGVEMTKEGVKLKLHDGLKASETLARQLNLLSDPDANQAKMAAEAAADRAVSRIAEVAERIAAKRSLPPPEETRTVQ